MTLDDRLNRAIRALAVAVLSIALVMVVLAFLHRIIAVVIVLGGGVFFAYLIYPAVRRLSARLPRPLAILCVYAVIGLIIALIMVVIGPKLVAEARSFGQDFPAFLQQAQAQVLGPNAGYLGAVPLDIREEIVGAVDQAAGTLQRNAGAIANQALTILVSLASVVTAFIIIPVLAFYLLLDADRLRAGFLRLVPVAHRDETLSVLHDVDEIVGGFIRGQLVVGACVGLLITVMLLTLGIKYALLIGVFAGVVNIVPYLGAIASAVPAVLIALFTHGFGWALLVVAGYVLVNQIEGHIIAPNVVGQRVGLTPLMVVVAILIGAELGGLLGMFIAVPTAAVIKALVLRFVPREPEETEAYVDLVSPQNAEPAQPVIAPATQEEHPA
ncbi:MAG: AI-2E family transporter [Candidatus Eremiobacteraeota bacterium]|nr:AI-2E family transporter [Candidatus Eremiobacteraeota bacterium]